jgi:Ribonuclease G/E
VILSELSVGLKVLRLLKRVAIQTPEKELLVLVHPAIAAYLMQENGRRVRHLEQKYGLSIQIQDDYHIHREDIKILSKRDMSELIVPD